MTVTAYSDSDFAGSADAKSTTGFAVLLAGSPVVWRSAKQTTVALSTQEAEISALVCCAKEVMATRNLLQELGLPQDAITIYEDNSAAIATCESADSRGRVRHLNVAQHFLFQHIKEKSIQLQYCPSASNVADIFTKPLQPSIFKALRSNLGIST